MPHSFSATFVHVVFSTKDRRPFLHEAHARQDMHRYLAGIASSRRCEPLIVGGVEDHAHLLLRLARTECQADLVRDLKRSSSSWIKRERSGFGDFAWQEGYACLSVSYRDLGAVRSYIDNQDEHHRKQSFIDEYRQLLIENGIALDEVHMWE